MPRLGVRTYGRLGQKSAGSSDAFDNAVSGKEKTGMDVSESTWDKAMSSFSKTNQNGEENNCKRRKTETKSGFGDPFTFESDEDSPRKKSPLKKGSEHEPMGPPASPPPQFMFSAKPLKTNTGSSAIIVGIMSESEKLGNGESEEANIDNLFDENIKRSVKTYRRTNKVKEDLDTGTSLEKRNSSEKLSRGTGQLPVSMFFKKNELKDTKNNNKDNGTVDSSEKDKIKTYDKPRKFFTSKNRNTRTSQISRSKDHTYSQGMHKFTVSRRVKEEELVIIDNDNDSDECKSDHNYSYMSNTKRLTADHTYSSCSDKQKLDLFLNRGTVSGEHAYGKLSNKLTNSTTSDGQNSGEEYTNNYLYDSDNELTSGDPEIIFNSPSKRAREAARLASEGGNDTDSLPEETSDYDSQKISDSQNTVISVSSLDSQLSSQGSRDLKTYSRKKAVQSPIKSLDSPMSFSSQSGTDSPAEKKERKYEIFRSRKSKQENDVKKDPAIRRILTSPKKVRFIKLFIT